MSDSENNKLTEKQVISILDTLYDKALNGIPKVSESVDKIVEDYSSKYATPKEAAKHLINYQITKCGISGFLTGLGGLITLQFALPANISSVLYIQLRMVAAIAKMGGYDIRSDQVQTMAYACLTGSAMTDVIKGTGIKIGQKVAVRSIERIPGEVLVKINQKVGFRLLTKFGEKGMVNLVKAVPIAGGLIGGGIDVTSTRIIGSNARRLFLKHNNLIDVQDTTDTVQDKPVFEAETNMQEE